MSCHTMVLPTGSPVNRSRTTVVSRWFVHDVTLPPRQDPAGDEELDLSFALVPERH